ncbi:MAG TPA: hypothetical protein VME69_14510 [Methylocella sp.]|nr:hypothetical protein [Methylocella sp.]
MSKQPSRPAISRPEEARQRRLEMQHLQAIEGNPLTPDEIAMFEMFEREGWSHERRRAHIVAQFKRPIAPEAAE